MEGIKDHFLNFDAVASITRIQGQPNILLQYDNYLNSLKTKDASIGEGIDFFAKLGYPNQGQDNRFLPNARYGVWHLGDMTAFLRYADQMDPNDGGKFFDIKKAAGNLQYGATHLFHGNGYTIDSTNKWVSYPPDLWIDLGKHDTMTWESMYNSHSPGPWRVTNNPSIKY